MVPEDLKINKKLIFPILFALFSSACNKNKTSNPSPAPTTSPTTLADPYSLMYTMYSAFDSLGIMRKDSLLTAGFSKQPIYTNNNTSVLAGTLTLNDTSFIVIGNVYIMPRKQCITGNLKWSCTGSGTITPFTHTYIASYPIYSQPNLLPDTISKSIGANLNISGISNFSNHVTAHLQEGTNIVPFISFSQNTVLTVTPSDLNSFSANTYAYFQMYMVKNKTENLGGVLHGFAQYYSYTKLIYIKP